MESYYDGVEIGSEMMVYNVPEEKVKEFNTWLDNFTWGGGVGFSIFNTETKGHYDLCVGSSFSHTWRNEIFFELIKFWKDFKITSSLDHPEFL